MNQVLPPVDVRLMNATASLAILGVFTLVCVAVGLWVLRNPAFAITDVVVHGNPQHNNAASLQANVLPQLKGNLFSLDLAHAQRAFEQMPWVRQAELRRGFPNTLEVFLQEHEPVALWDGPDDSTMLNAQGEVFEANRGEVEHLNLPNLAGPPERSQQVLEMYRYLVQQMRRHVQEDGRSPTMQPVALYLTPHGSWQMFLGNGAQLELGPGQQAQVGARLEDFFVTLPQVLAPLGLREQALAYADLRHRNGYAIRLRGVVTQEEGSSSAAEPSTTATGGATQGARAQVAAAGAVATAAAAGTQAARRATQTGVQKPQQVQPKPQPQPRKPAQQATPKPVATTKPTPQPAAKPAQSKPAAAKPANKPAETKPAAKPAAQTTSSKPAAKPAAQPAAKPAASKPAASKPAASKPAASKPAASKPAASKPAASKPAASKPATQPATKPAVRQGAANSQGSNRGRAAGADNQKGSRASAQV